MNLSKRRDEDGNQGKGLRQTARTGMSVPVFQASCCRTLNCCQRKLVLIVLAAAGVIWGSHPDSSI